MLSSPDLLISCERSARRTMGQGARLNSWPLSVSCSKPEQSRLRLSSSNRSIAAGCAAMRAVTRAPSPTAPPASARSASIVAACCTFRTATSAALQCDPIEKKPFFHAHPGALAFSFGMLGCDLHCSYCQNWVTSQALRDPQAVAPPRDASPAALVADAVASRRAGRRQHLQRAVDHERMGGRDLQGRARARADDRLCLERQRHAARAGLPSAVGRSLQSRSQEL